MLCPVLKLPPVIVLLHAQILATKYHKAVVRALDYICDEDEDGGFGAEGAGEESCGGDGDGTASEDAGAGGGGGGGSASEGASEQGSASELGGQVGPEGAEEGPHEAIPTDVKLAFFNETRHAYGRTALMLRYRPAPPCAAPA